MIDERGPTAFVYAAGNTRSFGGGGTDVLLQKYDANLNLLWTRTWGGPGEEDVYNAALDPDGDVYIVGAVSASSGCAMCAVLHRFCYKSGADGAAPSKGKVGPDGTPLVD